MYARPVPRSGSKNERSLSLSLKHASRAMINVDFQLSDTTGVSIQVCTTGGEPLLLRECASVNVTAWVRTRRALDCHAAIWQRLDTTGVVSSAAALQDVQMNPHAVDERDFIVAMLSKRFRVNDNGSIHGTYDLQGKTSIVGKVDDGLIEII